MGVMGVAGVVVGKVTAVDSPAVGGAQRLMSEVAMRRRYAIWRAFVNRSPR